MDVGEAMSLRQDITALIEQLTDEQVAILLPLVQSMKDKPEFSNESSQSYQDWLSSENDIYDETFADEMAAR
jgi:hypothetical protein